MKRSLTIALFTGAIFFFPGFSHSQSKIVGGTKAPSGSYPWMVAIADATGGSLYDRQFCGGALIAPDWVLTAAHCMEGETSAGLQIVAGFTDLNDTSGAEIRGVRGIYVHPGFVDIDGDLFNDIALILLDTPITNITPVAFAQTASQVPVGTTVRAIGWGDTHSSPRYPTELQMVDLDLVAVSLANRAYGINRLDQRHLAAMAAGKDTCAGDSGGPLFDADGDMGNPLLAGLTSYGLDCAVRGIPGIYANVGNFAPWINAFLAVPTVGDPQIEVSGRGLPIPNYTTSASTATGSHFGRRLRPGRSVVRQFAISNANGDIPLSLNPVGVTNRDFSVQYAPKYLFAGETGGINIRFRAPLSFRRGKSQGWVAIHNNDPVNPSFFFRVLAKYR